MNRGDAFSRHRAVYARHLNQLARHFAAPPAQWIGDRSTVVYASHHDEHPKMLEMEELHQNNPNRENPYDHDTNGIASDAGFSEDTDKEERAAITS